MAKTSQHDVQLGRSFGANCTATIGYTRAKISQPPVVTDINLINPVGTTADGRPNHSTAVNAGTRTDLRFNNVCTVQLVGSGHYNALSLSVARRFANGTTFNFAYTVAKGEDNTPLSQSYPATSALGVVSDAFRTEPANLGRDKGPNLLDTRHNFNGGIVQNPTENVSNSVLRSILNNNRFAFLLQFNSGLPFNITGDQDLNKDRFGSDRPAGVTRNSMYLLHRYKVDMRYSRFVPIRGSVKAETIGEFKNLFNTVRTADDSSTVAVDALEKPLSPIPTDPSAFAATSGYKQREFRLGFRLRFGQPKGTIPF